MHQPIVTHARAIVRVLPIAHHETTGWRMSTNRG